MAQQYGGPNGSQPLVMARAGGPAYDPGYTGPYAYSYEQPGPFAPPCAGASQRVYCWFQDRSKAMLPLLPWVRGQQAIA